MVCRSVSVWIDKNYDTFINAEKRDVNRTSFFLIVKYFDKSHGLIFFLFRMNIILTVWSNQVDIE